MRAWYRRRVALAAYEKADQFVQLLLRGGSVKWK